MSDVTSIVLECGASTVVDTGDLHLVAAYRWRVNGSRPGNIYVVASATNSNGGRSTIRLHRLIMGAKDGQVVDHINGDRMDNRRSNLRLTDATGNSQNASKRRGAAGGKSAFKGLTYRAKSKNRPWRVFVYCAKKRIFVGAFASELEAAAAYDEAAKQYHGEYARTNRDLGLLAA